MVLIWEVKESSLVLRNSFASPGVEMTTPGIDPRRIEKMDPYRRESLCRERCVGRLTRCKWPIMGRPKGLGGR